MSSSENDESGLFEENNNRLLVLLESGFKWISTLDLITGTFFFFVVLCSRVFCLVKYGLREKRICTRVDNNHLLKVCIVAVSFV